MARNHTGAVRVQGQDDGCCGVFFLKYVLYIFHFLLLLSGFGLLAVGVRTFFLTHYYIHILGGHFDEFAISTYLLLGTGGFIVFVVFVLGCCGTCNKNRGCLMTYAALLLIVMLAEVGAGVLTYMYEMSLETELSHEVQRSMNEYQSNEWVKWSVDNLQQRERCCGSQSYQDWFKVSTWTQTQINGSHIVPDSCCITQSDGCGQHTGLSNIHDKGCLVLLETILQESLIIMGGVGLGLCCLQIFGIVFSCCLAKKVRRGKVRENAYWE